MIIHRNLLILSTVSLLAGGSGFVLSQKVDAAANLTANPTPNPTAIVAQTTPQPRQEGGGCRGHRRPDFAAAAQQLGVSEAELIEALGLPATPPSNAEGRPPGRRPRLDIAGAAERLNVTEERLIEVLGIPPHPPGDRPTDQ